MNYILLGNIIAFIAAVLMVYNGIVLKKKKIIILEIIQLFILTVSNIILGSIPGAVNDLVGAFRNYLCYKNKLTILMKIVIIVTSVIITLSFNNLGIIGLLPAMVTVLYTLLIDTKNVIHFKTMIIITMIMWVIHDLSVQSYVMATMDLLTIITNSISIYKLRKNNK